MIIGKQTCIYIAPFWITDHSKHFTTLVAFIHSHTHSYSDGTGANLLIRILHHRVIDQCIDHPISGTHIWSHNRPHKKKKKKRKKKKCLHSYCKLQRMCWCFTCMDWNLMVLYRNIFVQQEPKGCVWFWAEKLDLQLVKSDAHHKPQPQSSRWQLWKL